MLSRFMPPDEPVAIAALHCFRREIGRLARSQSGVLATLLRQGGPRDRDIQ